MILNLPYRCSSGRYLYLQEGYWGGMVNGRFVTQICPQGYCHCSKKQSETGCFYDFKYPDDICKSGRVGTLCGKCKDGLAVSLQQATCSNCDGTGAFLGIFVGIIIILVFLIIYLNPNISPELRGILFYFQVIPFVFKPNNKVGYIVATISSIADFGRPTEHLIPTCAMPGLGNMHATALNYITPAVVLTILIFIYIFRRNIMLQRGKPFQCFFLLLVLVYKYLVEVSFSLLHCVDVGGKCISRL